MGGNEAGEYHEDLLYVCDHEHTGYFAVQKRGANESNFINSEAFACCFRENMSPIPKEEPNKNLFQTLTDNCPFTIHTHFVDMVLEAVEKDRKEGEKNGNG